MKRYSDRYIISTHLLWMLSITFFFLGCQEEEKMEFVDLRYEVADHYEISASNPAPIIFKVKSTKQWNVFSKHAPEWSTITPETGEPDQGFEVSVKYKNNVELDDRIDTIVIKSDYWVGKEVSVLQKGTAYLTLEGLPADGELIPEEGGRANFTIKSNQSWSVKVEKGSEWLSLLSAPSGSMNGDIQVIASPNKGERRSAEVAFYDRKNKLATTAVLTQNGILLDVPSLEIQIPYGKPEWAIEVTSNTDWEIAKDENTWYSFKDEQTDYSGNQTVYLKLDENESQFVRSAYVEIKSKGDAGQTPVIRRICIKQGYLPAPVLHEFNASERPNWEFVNGSLEFNNGVTLIGAAPRMMQRSITLGKYEFTVKSMDTGSLLRIFFVNGSTEIRCHLNAATKTTVFSTAPYSPLNGLPAAKTAFDPTKENTVGVELSANSDGFLLIRWTLNGEFLCEQIANHEKFILYFNQPLNIIIDANPGNVTLKSWQYSPLMDWNNELSL
ncbi:BACON domain-containing protein [Bacteroides sp.]|uniref:BACON domain-containing protein n=1 Tax=Bacteroides sp. TaxID=29523 RepID=UPI0025C201EF|nr:BACON domain-containing carbohydrate-binding protein [Bacteroides sp.]